mmetsp:Transcript_30380/g.69931  ORF Transcript_30380/g.69931 Transcript_30380/m.69931 type:complete len:160 (-) Transcript_30380:101-580(-)
MRFLWLVAACVISAVHGENFKPKPLKPDGKAFVNKPPPFDSKAKPAFGKRPPIGSMIPGLSQSLKTVNETQVAQIHAQQEKQFAMLDEDHSGNVSTEEVQALKDKLNARKKAGEKLESLETTLLRKMESKDWLEKADKNKDGIITLDEYKFDRNAKYDL